MYTETAAMCASEGAPEQMEVYCSRSAGKTLAGVLAIMTTDVYMCGTPAMQHHLAYGTMHSTSSVYLRPPTYMYLSTRPLRNA